MHRIIHPCVCVLELNEQSNQYTQASVCMNTIANSNTFERLCLIWLCLVQFSLLTFAAFLCVAIDVSVCVLNHCVRRRFYHCMRSYFRDRNNSTEASMLTYMTTAWQNDERKMWFAPSIYLNAWWAFFIFGEVNERQKKHYFTQISHEHFFICFFFSFWIRW